MNDTTHPLNATAHGSNPDRRRFTPFSVLTALGLTAWAGAVLPAPASAQDPETRGLAVAQAADARDTGWGDDASTMQMVLRNRGGQESTRTLRRMALETHGEGLGDRSIIVFEAPRDIEGTALLSHTRILEPDDQWLYLPALRRVKRISSGNKSGPFVGSEFAYEDLVSQEVDKYDYRWLRTEPCGDLECEVVERYPRYENSGYTKQVVWWDTEEYRIQRVDFHDRKGDLLKTLTWEGYAAYGDGYWRPDRMVMENHQNGKSTVLVFEEWRFGAGLDEDDFTPSRLRTTR
ncbi:MAG TPA: outer membrane lipoprotein-sorting protein [Longimicrobiales bacterium]|nr:outer membrane lipoprotein-sorting protein [Longimicrobiales bacterium]